MKSSEAKTGRIIRWPGHGLRARNEREFLPAALEVIETPPSSLGRGIGFTIILFSILALAWAWFGRVDITATARGRLVPVGAVKLVQPLDSGIVRAIHVDDGDLVHAGQVLVELDPTTSAADRDKINQSRIAAALDVARLAALKTALETGRPPELVPPADASAHDIDRTRATIAAEAAEQAAKLSALDQQIAQKRAEADEVTAAIDKLKETVPVLAQKEALRKQLLDIQFGNRFAYLDAEQATLEAQHDLTIQTRRATETDAARAVLERQRDQADAEYAHKILDDLAKAEQQLGEQTQELVKATRKSDEMALTAPIDGVVQQLAIHTVGGVVTPAQPLLIVVPVEATLLVDAMVSNRDVGFVREGQDVEVKIEAFNFTRYGLIHGRVVSVSRDAISPDQNKPERPEDRANPAKSEESIGSSYYVMRVKLDRESLNIDGRTRTLTTGMGVTAEIKTGSRKIISYLLSPLRQYANDSARER